MVGQNMEFGQSAFSSEKIGTQTDVSTRVHTRLWEIDAARGLAVVLMAFFHLMWDLQFFGLSDVDVFSPGWQLFARSIGSTFIFLLGLSLTLDAARLTSPSLAIILKRNLRRGAQILFCAMLVTAATYFLIGSAFVRFGILHLAAFSILLGSFFVLRPGWLSVAAGVAVLALSTVMPGLAASANSALFLPLGIAPPGLQMVDYYPLVPWFGMALLGIAAGKLVYPNGQRRFTLPDLGSQPLICSLRFLGRHSLAVYLLHQPILIALVFLVSLALNRSPF
jgi:uncharacterized membrane protein